MPSTTTEETPKARRRFVGRKTADSAEPKTESSVITEDSLVAVKPQSTSQQASCVDTLTNVTQSQEQTDL